MSDVGSRLAAKWADLMKRNSALENALKLARLHIADTALEHAVISLDRPDVGLGGYLDAVLAECAAEPVQREKMAGIG